VDPFIPPQILRNAATSSRLAAHSKHQSAKVVMRKYIAALFAGINFIQKLTGSSSLQEDTWFVAKGRENNLPLIIRARKQMPDIRIRQNFSWLAILSWDYSAKPNGMPEYETYLKMTELENRLESKLAKNGICIQVISRTGNGKKEWKYYITERQRFLESFHKVAKGKVGMPVEITFYHDPDWQELNSMLKSIRK
jgi:hypothetical protein